MNTGGPAFPVADTYHPNGQVQFGSYGMTLLDWFAGQALKLGSAASRNPQAAAIWSYEIASAMLSEKARREAVVQESSTTDHSPDAGKMIPDPFAEDALRQLASDVLPADIKDAASEERLTWCAEQVRAQVNTLEAQNRELVERIKRLNEAGDEMFKWSERVGQEYWMKAKEAKP